MRLRDYQERAVTAVREQWASGVRRVLLVSPTGSGKTRMGDAGTEGFHHVVWLAHRKELIKDAAERLAASMGGLEVGIIAAGVTPSPHSRVQVSSVQTLLRRTHRPPAELVVFDEGHHFVAEEWNQLALGYPDAKQLILTATPERQDGKPLTGIADVMVVAALHSELLAAGHLCDVSIFAPGNTIVDGIAMAPWLAWQQWADGQPGFAFFGSVDAAYECEHYMNALGIRAAVIEQGTDKALRSEHIQALRDGGLDCICNVQTMTEGVDVPRAAVCMLAARVLHQGGYLQRTGRVLRPHPSKMKARIIDLVGAWVLHGTPIDDREYSFDGQAIRRKSEISLRNCPKCGCVSQSGFPECQLCGYVFPIVARSAPAGPFIHSMELKEVYAGKDTPLDAKRVEYKRLRKLQLAQGHELYWVIKQYTVLFGEACIISDATLDEKRAFYGRMMREGSARGAKHKYAATRFKKVFGHWPPNTATKRSA